MSTKDTPPPPPARRASVPQEGPRAREAWEHEKLREFGLDQSDPKEPIYCPECHREMLERLAKAQARGSVLFQIIRQHGLSPLPLHALQPGAGDLAASAPAPRLAGWRSLRAVGAVLVGAAIAAMAFWAARAHLLP